MVLLAIGFPEYFCVLIFVVDFSTMVRGNVSLFLLLVLQILQRFGFFYKNPASELQLIVIGMDLRLSSTFRLMLICASLLY